MICKSQHSVIDATDFTSSTGTQIFEPEFFKTPTLLDEFVLIKIGSQISLTPKKDPIKPFKDPTYKSHFIQISKLFLQWYNLVCVFTL